RHIVFVHYSCARRALHSFPTRRSSDLIGITSVHEHQPRVGSAAYDAAKHGLGGLIKTIALELGQFGITANAVAPGEIATPMTGRSEEHTSELQSQSNLVCRLLLEKKKQ